MTFIDSWDRSTGYDDVTSLNGAASFLFGWKPKTSEIMDVNYGIQYSKATKMGQWYPTISGGNMVLDQVNTVFIPVNGILFWDMYGKATHTVADQTQTITNMTTTEGQKPKKKAYQQWDSTYKVDLFGLVTDSIKLKYDTQGLIATQSMKGTKLQSSSATPTTTTLPDDAADNPIDGAFDVFHSWSWNSVTLERPDHFSMEAQQELVPHMKGTDSYYVAMSEHNPIFTGFTAGVMGTTGLSDLWADFWAQTQRTLKWKMIKGSDPTKYFEVTASNAICHGINPLRESGGIMGYTAGFHCENVSIVVVDYLDDDWYTIKT